MAITSATDICNLSQDLLSGGIAQDVVNPSTPLEELLDRWYNQCRRKCLREHPWKFAIKRAILAASSTDPVFGYTKAFPVPNDFIRLLRVESDEGIMMSPESYQFEGGNILITGDASAVRLIYIWDIEDVTAFDPMFISYLALDISLATAYKITESGTKVQMIADLQKRHGAMSKAVSGQERPPIRINRSRNRAARMNPASEYSHRIIF